MVPVVAGTHLGGDGCIGVTLAAMAIVPSHGPLFMYEVSHHTYPTQLAW